MKAAVNGEPVTVELEDDSAVTMLTESGRKLEMATSSFTLWNADRTAGIEIRDGVVSIFGEIVTHSRVEP